MIKTLMLVFEPKLTWNKIALAKRSVGHVLVFFLVPVILLGIAGEMAGVIYLGRNREMEGNVKLPVSRVMAYSAAQLTLSFAVVFIGAVAVKVLTQNFQSRQTFAQCFTVVAHALGPLFAIRLLDAFPEMNPWVSFGIGIFFCLTTLYHGIPRVLEPDPVHGFGLYLVSALLLLGMMALARFLTLLILNGHLPI